MESKKLNPTSQKLWSSAAFYVATFLSLGAALASGVVEAAPAKVKIGVILPMSGGTAAFGQQVMSGFKMAVDEINKEKGPVQIEYVLEDDKSDVTDAANGAKKLINVDKVNIVVGSVASSNTNAMAPIAQAAGIPLMTPASTNVNVTQKGEFISRICFIDNFQGEAMANFAYDSLRVKKDVPMKAAIIIDASSDYSKGLADAFRESFIKRGGKISVEVSYQQKDQDFSSQLTKIRMSSPDVIFAPGYYTEVGTMIRQAKIQKIRAVFLGGDGWSGPQLFTLATEPAIIGHYYSDHFSPEDTDTRVQDFVRRYAAIYKTSPTGMTALGYDAAYFVVNAVKHNGLKVDPKGLAKAINSTKDFKGITGTISLDKNRNASKPLVVLQTQKDRATFVKRVLPAI